MDQNLTINSQGQEKTEFQRQKDEVETSLARTMLTQLDQGTIDYETARAIAQAILAKIDEIKNQEELLSFLNDLKQKWSIFEAIDNLYRLKITDHKETKEKLEEIKESLSQIPNN